MTSRRSVKTILKRAKRASEPFTVVIGGEEIEGTLTAVPYMRWQTILTDNPPRDGNLADEGWGFSVASFWADALREGWAEPEMDDEDWATFFYVVPVSEVMRLGIQVYTLTMTPAAVDVPKSSSASPEATTPNSD